MFAEILKILIRQAKLVKFLSPDVMGARIHLVANHHHGLARLAQQVGNVLIQVGDAHLNLHHEQDQIGLFKADFHLTTDGCLKAVIALGDPSSRVDDVELVLCPKHRPIFPVTRGATRVVRDGFTGLGQPIE